MAEHIVYTINGCFRPGQGSNKSIKAPRVARRWIDIDIKVTFVDDRRDYGEIRYRAYGFIDGVAYYLAFTNRNGRCGRSACGARTLRR
jgi:hypothetical protein